MLGFDSKLDICISQLSYDRRGNTAYTVYNLSKKQRIQIQQWIERVLSISREIRFMFQVTTINVSFTLVLIIIA